MSAGSITRIQLCGQFAVVVDGRRIEDSLPGRRGRLLVAYLAAHRRQPVNRDEIIDAIWPGGSGVAAAASLTVLLSKIRSLLGHESIRGRGALQLVLDHNAVVDAETAVVALHRAESAVALGQWRRGWALVLGAQFTASRRYLDNFEAPWIDVERTRFELIYQKALTCYAQACIGIGGTELPAAERAARELIACSPISETGYRLLIEALAHRGDISSALHAYEQLRRTLADELGVDPSPQTRQLHHRLLVGLTPPAG